jgi:hypothetical protein
VTPDDLLSSAQDLLASPNRRLGTSRLLGATFLIRQALEEALDRFWQSTVAGMETVSRRAQLVSLPYYLADHELAGNVIYAWNRLSEACHHDAYALPPPPVELQRYAAVAKRFSAAVKASGVGPATEEQEA